MNEGLSTSSIDGLLTDTRAALDRMRTTPAAPAVPTAGAGAVDATDESKRVRVTVDLPGRITALAIDPRLLRQGSEAVCDAITEAVNAGLASLQALALRDVPTIDVESLAAELEHVHTQSLQSASTMLTALQDTMDRLTRGN